MTENLTRLRGTRETYLRIISNQEQQILFLIESYSSEKEIQLKASKNRFLEKVKKLDDEN